MQTRKLLLCCLLYFFFQAQTWAIFNFARSVTFPKNDSVITAHLRALIATEPWLSKTPLTIKTEKGVVSLEGQVGSEALAGKLVILAETIAGTQEVDTSKLTFYFGQTLSADRLISYKLKGIFIREGLAPQHILIDCHKGFVTLHGKVDSAALAESAEKLAKALSGVKEVRNQLTFPPP